MCVAVYLNVCVYTECMPGTCRGQKRVPDLLEGTRVVRHYVGAGNRAKVLFKSGLCS